MTPRERGFLLLTSHLGDRDRRVLTVAQMRLLAQRVALGEQIPENRELEVQDLLALGLERELAERIVMLLSQEELLDQYLRRARRSACVPLTRGNSGYPPLLRQRLGLDSPGCLWGKGDISILQSPTVALVGSRELREANRNFAEMVGIQAATQGLALVSGNARGADRVAQESCLAAGGRVIAIVAEELAALPLRERVFYLSEETFDEGFSVQRALSRNRCIHALGQLVFVAQSDLEKGGTWDGTVKNLRYGWSTVVGFRDGSEAMERLAQMGAYLIAPEELQDFSGLCCRQITFF